MKYFAKITATYVAKNKAHSEIQQYARNEDSTLFESEEAKDKFVDEFKSFIDEVNARYPRSNDIELSGYIFSHQTISVDGNFHMTIYEVKHSKS